MDKPSLARTLSHTIVTNEEINAIEQLVQSNRELTSRQLKNQLNLRASLRTVQKYLNALGWVKKTIRYENRRKTH